MMRASHQQFATLVELMERYGDLARPQQGPQGRVRADRLWHEVEGTLNAIGGGVTKSVEKWKKVWADWKTKTKKKALLIRREATRTGGGPSSRLTLSLLEERVLALMGLSAVEGIQMIEEIGFGETRLTQPSLGDHPYAATALPHSGDEDESPSQHAEPPPAFIPPPPPPLPPPPPVAVRAPPPVAVRAPSPVAVRAPPPVAVRAPQPHVEPREHRRRRQQTPFERAVSEFAMIEDRRLNIEEEKERKFHERELKRMKVDEEKERKFHDREIQRMKVEEEKERKIHEREIQRMKVEEEKERKIHEREIERMKIDDERNKIFARIADGVNNLIAEWKKK